VADHPYVLGDLVEITNHDDLNYGRLGVIAAIQDKPRLGDAVGFIRVADVLHRDFRWSSWVFPGDLTSRAQ
jgi:hypothetical protein